MPETAATTMWGASRLAATAAGTADPSRTAAEAAVDRSDRLSDEAEAPVGGNVARHGARSCVGRRWASARYMSRLAQVAGVIEPALELVLEFSLGNLNAAWAAVATMTEAASSSAHSDR